MACETSAFTDCIRLFKVIIIWPVHQSNAQAYSSSDVTILLLSYQISYKTSALTYVLLFCLTFTFSVYYAVKPVKSGWHGIRY